MRFLTRIVRGVSVVAPVGRGSDASPATGSAGATTDTQPDAPPVPTVKRVRPVPIKDRSPAVRRALGLRVDDMEGR